MTKRLERIETRAGCDLVANCNSSFEPFLNKIPTSEVLANYGFKLVMPRIYLFGTQPADQYISKKRRIVEDRLTKCGIFCLDRNPPFLTALFNGNIATVAILDGHNRIRYSPKFRIAAVPSLMLSLEEVTELMQKAEPQKQHDAESVREIIESDIRSTLDSFRGLPREKQPNFISGVSNMAELYARFSLSNARV